MLRFATSPTGDMSIGNLRVALFNYIVSQQQKEDLIVRIEDTDKEKNIDSKDQEILDTLDLFGIKYSQVIYQSQNIRFHSAMALQLVHEKKAFSCFCSDDWLEKKRDEAQKLRETYQYDDACANLPDELVIDNMNPFRIRLRKPKENIIINDYIKGEINFKSKDIDSFIIMTQDKTPTHNFSCAIDDMLNNISLVIRCEEHINNTPIQNHIRSALKYDKKIDYAHLPIILNGDFSVKGLLEEGFLPSAISNYLLLMDNETPCEIFSIEDAIKWFDLSKISKSPTPFDIETLKHINKEHLKNMDAKELSRFVGFADTEIGELARIYLEEVDTTKELKNKIAPIFAKKEIPKEFQETSKIIVETIKNAPYFDEYNDFKNYIIKESKLKNEDLEKSLYFILTGTGDGPDIEKIYKYLKNYIGGIVK
ncbi:MAG: glutamate--tRNA ligase [Campylobacterota bacterium]|nr:glutamate--tRNA ligase [Campylobacterota bacterium]